MQIETEYFVNLTLFQIADNFLESQVASAISK